MRLYWAAERKVSNIELTDPQRLKVLTSIPLGAFFSSGASLSSDSIRSPFRIQVRWWRDIFIFHPSLKGLAEKDIRLIREFIAPPHLLRDSRPHLVDIRDAAALLLKPCDERRENEYHLKWRPETHTLITYHQF